VQQVEPTPACCCHRPPPAVPTSSIWSTVSSSRQQCHHRFICWPTSGRRSSVAGGKYTITFGIHPVFRFASHLCLLSFLLWTVYVGPAACRASLRGESNFASHRHTSQHLITVALHAYREQVHNPCPARCLYSFLSTFCVVSSL
jgi:hypothetical protein